MRYAVAIAVFFTLAALYANWIRPNMRETEWGQRFLARIEPFERIFYWKSETIFMARVKMLCGILLTIATQAGAIDITPIMPLVPDAWEPTVRVVWNALPMIATVVGWFDQSQRFDTTKPVELVAMRTDAPEEVKAAAETAEAVNKEVVAIAKQAGAV